MTVRGSAPARGSHGIDRAHYGDAVRSIRGLIAAAVTGLVLGVGAGFADSVPLMLNEVGAARADRSGWSQASEFVSLILDSGWAWAATAVLAGWLISRPRRLVTGGATARADRSPVNAAAGSAPQPDVAAAGSASRPEVAAADSAPRPEVAVADSAPRPEVAKAGSTPPPEVAAAGTGPRPIVGAVAGFVALSIATVAFYAVQGLFADDWGGWWYQVEFWLVRALVLGMPLGAVGVLARRGGIAGALAALVVPVGAVLNLIVLPLPSESRMAVPVEVTIWTAAIAGVVLIAFRLVRERMRPVSAGAHPRPVSAHEATAVRGSRP